MSTGVCVGCLGSTRCWVCLGTGFGEPEQRRGVCNRCGGSRRCHVCDGTGRGDGKAIAPPPPPRLVLVVDDEPDLLDLVTIWLDDDPRCRGVHRASTGDAALTLLADLCPDTIVCDFQLGHATSAEYLPGFRSACPSARIVIHTGNPDLARRAGVVERGADQVLEKGTITLQELVDAALGETA